MGGAGSSTHIRRLSHAEAARPGTSPPRPWRSAHGNLLCLKVELSKRGRDHESAPTLLSAAARSDELALGERRAQARLSDVDEIRDGDLGRHGELGEQGCAVLAQGPWHRCELCGVTSVQ